MLLLPLNTHTHLIDEVQHFVLREVHAVVSEILPVLHVVDVHPQDVQGQVEGSEVGAHVLHCLQVRVATMYVYIG